MLSSFQKTKPNMAKKRSSSSAQSASPSSSKKLKNKTSTNVEDLILRGLQEQSDPKTKTWFTNYVKGSEWIGCKTPTVRSVVRSVAQEHHLQDNPKHDLTIDTAIALLQHKASDAKLGGMMLLQEVLPRSKLASHAMLDRFDRDLWSSSNDNNTYMIIADWSTADWFAVRVLKHIVFFKNEETGGNFDESLIRRVLGYTQQQDSSLWHRRCGVIPFLDYHKHRSLLPEGFGSDLIKACEESLLISPQERFTQTGVAWVLRYVLLQKEERNEAFEMIQRHGEIWTTEAKKSLVEKLGKRDRMRTKILSLGSE